MASPAVLIAEEFNRYFANFEIRIEADAVRIGARSTIRQRGWLITTGDR